MRAPTVETLPSTRFGHDDQIPSVLPMQCCDDAGVLVRRDDRVLVSTRLLALVIIPFLLGAFVILYGFPRHTARLFASPIKPTMTSMMLASAYLGGAYFFVRVLAERHWNVIKGGFPPVVLFASLLGVATVTQWDVFNHRHVTFWVWATLYFTTPFLVFAAWLANRRVAGVPAADELRLSPLAKWVIGVIGSWALIQGLVMFVAPGLVVPFWPWSVTALSCRVIGAIFSLGVAGLVFHRSEVEHRQTAVPGRNDHGDTHADWGTPRRARVPSPQGIDLAARLWFRCDPRRLGLPLGSHDRTLA